MQVQFSICNTNKNIKKMVPMYFWYSNDHVRTGTKLRSETCLGCGMYTYIIPYCRICAVKHQKLLVSGSDIKTAGLGIFAGRHMVIKETNRRVLFNEDDVVCVYGNEENRISYANVVGRYGTLATQPYTYMDEEERYYDSCNYRTIGAIINDNIGTDYSYNVVFVEKDGIITIEAIDTIREGDELYIEYGESYWSEIHNCKYSTSTKPPDTSFYSASHRQMT